MSSLWWKGILAGSLDRRFGSFLLEIGEGSAAGRLYSRSWEGGKELFVIAGDAYASFGTSSSEESGRGGLETGGGGSSGDGSRGTLRILLKIYKKIDKKGVHTFSLLKDNHSALVPSLTDRLFHIYCRCGSSAGHRQIGRAPRSRPPLQTHSLQLFLIDSFRSRLWLRSTLS